MKLKQWWRKIFPVAETQSVTIRYMYPVLFSFLAILAASVITSSDTSYVELVPSTSLVMSGERFSIDVYAYAHVPVNALDVVIDFSPDSVTILGVDQGESVLTIWTEEPTIEGDRISFGGGTYRRGFVGRHLVATINVEAKTSGQTEFILTSAQLLAGDGSGTAVPLTQSNDKTTKSFIIYDEDEDPSQLSANLGMRINADIDGDGMVTLRDVSSFMAAWYSGTTSYDFNNDNKMNFVDFSIILARSFFDQGGS